MVGFSVASIRLLEFGIVLKTVPIILGAQNCWKDIGDSKLEPKDHY